MTIGQSLLPEFDQEMMLTRRLLERVPSDKVQWKPHPKSFALGHLAQLVAWIPGWITSTLRKPYLDLAGGGGSGGYSFETTDFLVKLLDENVRGGREAVAEVDDGQLAVYLRFLGVPLPVINGPTADEKAW